MKYLTKLGVNFLNERERRASSTEERDVVGRAGHSDREKDRRRTRRTTDDVKVDPLADKRKNK